MRAVGRPTQAALALICVLVVGAGITVTRLLPARLAQWDIARLRRTRVATGGPVLTPVPRTRSGSGHSLPPTTAGVSAKLAPLLGGGVLGAHVGLLVTDLSTGRTLDSQDPRGMFIPASTTKLATATAALALLGPSARFTTKVVAGRLPGSVILVGGGDPTLAAGPQPKSDYPRAATLKSLAAATSRVLRERGEYRVRLGYDSTLFTGRVLGPGWSASYVTTGNVAPVTALEVDQGRLTRSGRPQDADDPLNTRPRSLTPAQDAARAFARFLKADGITVSKGPSARRAMPDAPVIAAVASPPLDEVVQWMLMESNNEIAEFLARQVALASGRSATFAGGAAATMSELARLGVRGVHLVDGSGLSPYDRISPAALIRLLALAAGYGRAGRTMRADLRPVITGLPVAGFAGTLEPGHSVFAEAGRAALGVVRAKTGNLDTVAALAGLAYARDGHLLAFAVMADQLPKGGLLVAGRVMAAVATALAGCGCH